MCVCVCFGGEFAADKSKLLSVGACLYKPFQAHQAEGDLRTREFPLLLSVSYIDVQTNVLPHPRSGSSPGATTSPTPQFPDRADTERA